MSVPIIKSPLFAGTGRAIAYIRTARNEPSGFSLKAQRQRIADHCQGYGLDLAVSFEDIGVSGSTDFNRRPGGRQLLEWLMINGPAVVVATAPDRFSRSPLDAITAALWITGHKGTLRTISGDVNIDTTTCEGWFAIAIAWEQILRIRRGDDR